MGLISFYEYHYELVNFKIRCALFGDVYVMEIQDGSVSYVHSTGALICVFASFLAAVVSYLALRSRGRSNRRGINHGCGSTSAPLSKACHQLGPLQGDRTKEWMYSTCTECSHSEEVRI